MSSPDPRPAPCRHAFPAAQGHPPAAPGRRAVLAGLLLAGCGFTPALREGAPARGLLNRVAYVLPDGRIGFTLRNSLEERLGRPSGSTPYTLTANLVIADSALAITPDSSITRYVLRGTSAWSLTGPDLSLSGEAQSMSAYSATGSLFATRAARRDAEERVARDIGQRIWTAVAAASA